MGRQEDQFPLFKHGRVVDIGVFKEAQLDDFEQASQHLLDVVVIVSVHLSQVPGGEDSPASDL